MPPKKIYISFASKDPDELVAHELYTQFEKAGHVVFLASEIQLTGTTTGKEMLTQLKNSDFFIVLLSERSMMSDLITGQVFQAKQLYDKQQLGIIPIRLKIPPDYNINYDLKEYLQFIPAKQWADETDTPELVRVLLNIFADTTAQPTQEVVNQEKNDTDTPTTKDIPVPCAPLIIPGGNVKHDSYYYITRDGEEFFKKQIFNAGSLLRIKGPRQFGKTSLLARLLHLTKENDIATIPLSFQQISVENLNNLENLLVQLCVLATRKLSLPNRIKEFWDDDFMDVKMKCTAYFEEYLLPESDKLVFLAIDEADRLFEFSDVSNEFFSMLRYWHEERNNNDIWNNFKLAVSHSTEAYLAIDQIHQSPFNVGIERVLEEFTQDRIDLLAYKHGLKFTSLQIRELMDMIGGHPYLVHKAFYEIAAGNYSFESLIKHAPNDDGPFADHLRRHHWNLLHDTSFIQTMNDILHKGITDNVIVANKLKAAGLVKGAIPDFEPSFKLYEIYFGSRL